MPLDGKITDFVKPAAPDLTKPSLEALAWVLEHPETWPKGWSWNFGDYYTNECGTAGCALGIAATIWRTHQRAPALLGIQMTRDGAIDSAIFIRGCDDPDISPAAVAGRIRDHLAGRAIRYLVEGDRS